MTSSNDLGGLHDGQRGLGLAFLTLLCAGIGSMGSVGLGCTGDGDGDGPGPDFDDHSVPSVATLDDFEALSAAGPSSESLKFIITKFEETAPTARFLDSRFYTLHDEWYWFRLLNGASVDGVDTVPVEGLSFDTIAEIVDWARPQDPSALPLDLTFVSDGRLYSPQFYAFALPELTAPPNDLRQLGIGTVVHFPARPDVELDEQWAIELEFQHQINKADLERIFQTLAPILPSDVGDRLKLLVRSSQQETFAQSLESTGDPLAERILRYSDVSVPGETEVYSEGLIAGRLKLVRSGEPFDDARSTDILVTEEVPDFLPQCAALVTSVPQTALAHVNILAKNRGIPNAYRAGVLDDPELSQLARARAAVVVKASATEGLRIVAMTESEFSDYRGLTVVPPSAVQPVDINAIERTYDLATLDFADQDEWRPILGGKSVGFVALLTAEDITAPPKPLGISVKPYKESIVDLEPALQAMLLDTQFSSDPNVRLLVLDGPEGWRVRHPEQPNFPSQFLSRRPPGDTLRALVEDGGVQRRIRDLEIPPAALEDIMASLIEHFGDYAPEQGLRFRSSSNVEDAEGFNGAGLYTSNTGYIHADEIGKEDKSVENALKETWASYWGSEAFEERKLANVAHLSGSMGVAVHANFQDDLELSNAVFTYTILPPGHPEGRALLEINAQEGALSVTNPPPGDPNLPEVARVRETEFGFVVVERVRDSTVLRPGQRVLSDAQLLHVFDQAKRVTETWLAVENSTLPASQERSTLTLDFELREVAQGWPALDNGNVFGERLVIKQARTLEPSIVRASPEVRSMPIPRDVLARALRVEERTCNAEAVSMSITEVFTDSRKTPDLGFEKAPFSAFVVVTFNQAVPELGAVAGQRRSAVHTAFEADHPGLDDGADESAWALDLVVNDAAAGNVGFDAITFDPDGTLSIERGGATFSALAECGVEVPFASPEQFLESILAREPE